MSRSYWLSIFAVVGWITAVGLASAQQPSGAPAEGEPIAPRQNEVAPKDAEGGNDEQQQPETERLVPVLVEIERAIRDLVNKEEPPKDQGQEDREKADLQAQQDMATWAERMLWATGVGLFLTLAGLVLIRKTLLATQEAARHTKGMLVEAEKATKFAEAAAQAAARQADVAMESFRRLERPYLYFESCRTEGIGGNDGAVPNVRIRFRNYGKSPATLIRYGIRAEFSPSYPLRVPFQEGEDVYAIIAPNDAGWETPRIQVIGTKNLGHIPRENVTSVIVHGLLQYLDHFNSIHTERFCIRFNEHLELVMESGNLYNWRKSNHTGVMPEGVDFTGWDDAPEHGA